MILLKKILRKISNKVITRMIGKRKWQNIFEEMYFTSLHGMNIGSGGDYVTSGEKKCFGNYFK